MTNIKLNKGSIVEINVLEHLATELVGVKGTGVITGHRHRNGLHEYIVELNRKQRGIAKTFAIKATDITKVILAVTN